MVGQDCARHQFWKHRQRENREIWLTAAKHPDALVRALGHIHQLRPVVKFSKILDSDGFCDLGVRHHNNRLFSKEKIKQISIALRPFLIQNVPGEREVLSSWQGVR